MDETRERLQKYLARAGVASRRHSEILIAEGRVRVNGQVVTEMGTQVGLNDRVSVDGKVVIAAPALVYYALNKPTGYVSTASDERGRPTVLDLVPSDERVYPIGRLYMDSEGLILLTNDGDLANRLTHPRHEVEREYRVLVEGSPEEEAIRTLRSGVQLDDGTTSPARVERLGNEGERSWLRLVIHEGRKRQVRRMCEAVGYRVIQLIRVRIGPIHLGQLDVGKARALSAAEVDSLRSASKPEPRREAGAK
jgi:23S rRNA pseudouridine2605 synthase